MKVLEKILIATDLSSSTDELVQNGIDIAKLVGAKIILVYVLKLNIDNKKIQQFLLSAAKSQLKMIRKRIRKEGVECDDPIVAYGDTYNEIVKEANIHEVNLILMSSSNEEDSSIERLGSTTEKVIQKTEVPVWVHKKGSSLKISTILCPVDFSKSSTRALKNAIVITKRFNAKLFILNVYESEHPYDHLDIHFLEKEIEKEKEKNEAHFKKYLRKIDFRGIDWEHYLFNGFPDVEILKFIKKEKIDLLIMGTTGKSALTKIFMGSITEKVTRRVPCSFITSKSKNLIKVVVEAKMNDLDTHFREAQLLFKDGFYDRAKSEYQICLDIDNMHIRSFNGIAAIYEKLGKQKRADHYYWIAQDIYEHMWNNKIENEIRKNYSVKGDFHLHN